MGQVSDEGESITAAVNGKIWNGYNISVGNPHAVVFVDDINDVGPLQEPPVVRPKDSYPEGVNVEFVQIISENEILMRVYERGSGETQSCGTGTCAVALAATIHSNKKLPSTWIINPPGGRLEVSIDGHSNATLIGPAVLVKDVDISRFLIE
jgi:diaminopimelate epimerase